MTRKEPPWVLAVFPGTMLLVAPVGRPRRERMLVGRALAAGAAGVLLVLCATERATHAPAHIAALERQQELKVVMSECVDCLSACPGYVQNRSSFDNTSSFNEFSRLAQKECGMCYQGVKGPCPADANNHGVLRAVDNKRGGVEGHQPARRPAAAPQRVDRDLGRAGAQVLLLQLRHARDDVGQPRGGPLEA